MKNEFINLFSTLDDAEKTAFEYYISALYKQQKAVLKTFKNVVEICKKKANNEQLTIAKIDKKTQNDLSDLKKWLIEFITIQEIKNNSYEAQFLTIEALRKRNMTALLAKKTDELRTSLKAKQAPNTIHHLMKLGLNHIAYFNTENDKLDGKTKADIDALMSNLDLFYIAHKLQYSTEMQNRTDILKEQYEFKLLPEVLDFLGVDASLSSIIYDLHLPLYQLAKHKSETAYLKIKAFLSKDNTLEKVEKLTILLNLLNFSTQRMRKSDRKYLIEFFQLSQIGVEQSLFTAAGFFPTRSFNNIVNAALQLGEYKWAKTFIDNSHKDLKPDDAEIAHTFALARYAFANKNFDDTISFLGKLTKHKNIQFSLEIRSLMVRTYYEKREAEKLQNNYSDAFELYIRRISGINEDLRKSVLNFIKIMRLLIDKKPKKQVLDTLNSLLKNEPVLHSEWLTLKIETSPF